MKVSLRTKKNSIIIIELSQFETEADLPEVLLSQHIRTLGIGIEGILMGDDQTHVFLYSQAGNQDYGILPQYQEVSFHQLRGGTDL